MSSKVASSAGVAAVDEAVLPFLGFLAGVGQTGPGVCCPGKVGSCPLIRVFWEDGDVELLQVFCGAVEVFGHSMTLCICWEGQQVLQVK